MTMRTGLAAAMCAGLWLGAATASAAQDSRAQSVAQEQSEKAAAAHPYEPSKAERRFLSLKREFIDSPSGFYPLVGSVYAGGGLAFGAGYRQYYGDRSFWDIKGLWSIKNYTFAEASTESPGHARGKIDFGARVGWRNAVDVAYYGIGDGTSQKDRANSRLRQIYAGAGAKARPVSWVVFGGRLDYEDYTTKGGEDPAIERSYTAATAPGLGTNPAYIHSTATAGIDWRPAEGYARRGGLYEVRYHDYRDRDDRNSFGRIETEVVQHVPILRENWVLSGRGLVNSIVRETDTPPYFMLPSLGNGSNLRGYSAWRFRDRHSLLLQGEFRWIPNRTGIDMAIFYDVGKVTSRRTDLNFDGLRRGVGAEVRFHGPAATPLRIGIGRGSEGWNLLFGGTAAF